MFAAKFCGLNKSMLSYKDLIIICKNQKYLLSNIDLVYYYRNKSFSLVSLEQVYICEFLWNLYGENRTDKLHIHFVTKRCGSILCQSVKTWKSILALVFHSHYDLESFKRSVNKHLTRPFNCEPPFRIVYIRNNVGGSWILLMPSIRYSRVILAGLYINNISPDSKSQPHMCRSKLSHG